MGNKKIGRRDFPSPLKLSASRICRADVVFTKSWARQAIIIGVEQRHPIQHLILLRFRQTIPINQIRCRQEIVCGNTVLATVAPSELLAIFSLAANNCSDNVLTPLEASLYQLYETDIRLGLAKAYLAETSSLERISESHARALDNAAKEMSRARRL